MNKPLDWQLHQLFLDLNRGCNHSELLRILKLVVPTPDWFMPLSLQVGQKLGLLFLLLLLLLLLLLWPHVLPVKPLCR